MVSKDPLMPAALSVDFSKYFKMNNNNDIFI